MLQKLAAVPRRLMAAGAELIGVLLATRSAGVMSETAQKLRLTFVQFGDYAEGYRRFAEGGAETYYAQRYSVDFVGSLAATPNIECVTVINIDGDAAAAVLPNGVHTRGIDVFRPGQPARQAELVEAVKATRPTHLVVNSPNIPVIVWGIRAGIPVLPVLADSFRAGGVLASFRHRLLATLLNARAVQWVSNHSLAASLDLKRIGVDSRKILPFDWPAVMSPSHYAPKEAPPATRPFRLVYVGTLIESKGVGDAIRAVASLRRRGRSVELTIIGRGESAPFQAMAATENVEAHIHFLGPRPHAEVVAAMRDHDAVVVPSRWAYPEGLPMTLYEALCTRTPLLTSNHPMFALRIRDRYNALVFPEQDPEGLAASVEALAGTPALYADLSVNSASAAESYLCPLKYDGLISAFLRKEQRAGLGRYALATQVSG